MASNTRDTAIPSLPLTEFTLFPKLPIELRLKVFRYALPVLSTGPRVVQVSIKKSQYSYTTIKTKKRWVSDKRKHRVVETKTGKVRFGFALFEHEHGAYMRDLGMLVACSESREVVLERFTGAIEAYDGGLIRFAKEDILKITNFHEFLPTHGNNYESISCQNLAFPITAFAPGWYRNIWDCAILNPAYTNFFESCEGLKRVGNVWNGNRKYRDCDDPKWRVAVLDWMRKATAFWEEWKGYGVGKAKWASLELCVWGIDGNLVGDERAGRGV